MTEYRKDLDTLQQLGSQKTNYTFDAPTKETFETFSNPHPQRNYQIKIGFPEFTSLCPKTGQPDFATITIKYVADALCVETKSLKLYMFQYRNYGAFMEDIVNTILNDLVSVLKPREALVIGEFNTRGGTDMTVSAKYPSDLSVEY
jgi:7-cyano-7-deazaguanine reductase